MVVLCLALLLDIYCYYLGREGQSVSKESMKKNVLQHEKVAIRLVEEYEKRKKDLSLGKQKYILDKLIIHMCTTQYIICTEYFKNSKNFQSFDKKLSKYPDIYNDVRIAGGRIKLYRKMKGKIIWANKFLKKSNYKLTI